MSATNEKARKPGRPRKAVSYVKQTDQITVHMPSDLVNALDTEISMSGISSRSELIREACQHYLDTRKEERPTISATQRLRGLPLEERQKTMAQAAKALTEYYRTDPEVQEWQALEAEDFYDVDH